MSELNKRQRTFVEAYAIPGTECYGNATKSAIKAGYKESRAEVTGCELVRNSKIQEYIKGVEQKLFDEQIMSGKEVLYRLTRTARGETVEIEPVVTKQGTYKINPTTGKHNLVYDEDVELIEKPPKISDQNKALELLGKHHKLFTDVQDMNVNGVVTFNDDIN
ncbi:TPA: terminase small subunit [Staphylococcus aureus]|uniref:ORF028 n=3 Tax=root TaxID=1 RepID=Q4ZAQ7_9CAUD|nr:terminase small subunit [Staphylococcus aureus]YP_240669.1 terminase small subunit [Staphylococcus phage 88]YP_240741.1 terminase small subunit [Staphylococcus phage 92]AAX91886.1 ORF028 [Staphylococcus phage 88]AAX91958.1 ORF027 [Staphylococcus phage 92]THJ29253.1 terminase small subunit [Staphylococcus aureus]CAC9429452.1 phage terminase small subunit [Staphylococcus aureus]CXT55724.1 phage terminase small subunit [Staphylococcus aureus]